MKPSSIFSFLTVSAIAGSACSALPVFNINNEASNANLNAHQRAAENQAKPPARQKPTLRPLDTSVHGHKPVGAGEVLQTHNENQAKPPARQKPTLRPLDTSVHGHKPVLVGEALQTHNAAIGQKPVKQTPAGTGHAAPAHQKQFKIKRKPVDWTPTRAELERQRTKIPSNPRIQDTTHAGGGHNSPGVLPVNPNEVTSTSTSPVSPLTPKNTREQLEAARRRTAGQR